MSGKDEEGFDQFIVLLDSVGYAVVQEAREDGDRCADVVPRDECYILPRR